MAGKLARIEADCKRLFAVAAGRHWGLAFAAPGG
jgi:hypothetical protein